MSAEVSITRVFDASPDQVFDAWTSAEHLERWHAPEGCQFTLHRADFQPGGTFLSCVSTPSGFNCWCSGTYHEVVRPVRIEYSIFVCDEEGNRLTSEAAGHDSDWPEETVVSVSLRELADGKTELTLRQNVSQALAERTGAYPSWLQMLDKLASDLAG